MAQQNYGFPCPFPDSLRLLLFVMSNKCVGSMLCFTYSVMSCTSFRPSTFACRNYKLRMHHMIPKLIIKSINIFKRNILVVFKKKKIIKKGWIDKFRDHSFWARIYTKNYNHNKLINCFQLKNVSLLPILKWPLKYMQFSKKKVYR